MLQIEPVIIFMLGYMARGWNPAARYMLGWFQGSHERKILISPTRMTHFFPCQLSWGHQPPFFWKIHRQTISANWRDWNNLASKLKDGFFSLEQGDAYFSFVSQSHCSQTICRQTQWLDSAIEKRHFIQSFKSEYSRWKSTSAKKALADLLAQRIQLETQQ